MRVHALAPVVAIDLDGTSGDYHGHFVWFLNNIYLPNSQPRIYERWQNTKNGEFSQALSMSKPTYRDAKLAYRQGGLKRCMPLFEVDREKGGIEQDIQYIRSLEIQVWVTTNRPWMRLDNIDKDTKFWIDAWMGEVDGVIFSQEKYHDLIDNVGKERILGVFDDLPENIEAAEALGLNAVLRRGPHNEWWLRDRRDGLSSVVPAVSRFKDFTYHVEEWKEDYKA